MMLIDNMGFDEKSPFFMRKELSPFIVLPAGEVTYSCFKNTTPRAIHRVTTDPATGQKTMEWAWGAWEDRATLTYRPVNDTLTIAEGVTE